MAKEKFPFLLDSKNFDVHVHYMYMLAVGNILSFGDFNMEKKITLTGVSPCIYQVVKRQKNLL